MDGIESWLFERRTDEEPTDHTADPYGAALVSASEEKFQWRSATPECLSENEHCFHEDDKNQCCWCGKRKRPDGDFEIRTQVHGDHMKPPPTPMPTGGFVMVDPSPPSDHNWPLVFVLLMACALAVGAIVFVIIGRAP